MEFDRKISVGGGIEEENPAVTQLRPEQFHDQRPLSGEQVLVNSKKIGKVELTDSGRKFCAARGHMKRNILETMVSRAGRSHLDFVRTKINAHHLRLRKELCQYYTGRPTPATKVK